MGIRYKEGWETKDDQGAVAYGAGWECGKCGESARVGSGRRLSRDSLMQVTGDAVSHYSKHGDDPDVAIEYDMRFPRKLAAVRKRLGYSD